MKIFINHTNHPSSGWTDKQKSSVSVYGKIVDLPFPDIEPDWDSKKVKELAGRFFNIIYKTSPSAVLCQGESVYSFELVSLLKKAGIKVLAACSKRNVKEKPENDRINRKEVYFEFVGFREY